MQKLIHFNIRLLLILFSSGIMFTSCEAITRKKHQEQQNEEVFDLPEILKRGRLIVLMENSSTSFFVYRGKKMGFEYELLKEFANDLGVVLEVKIINNLDKIDEMLEAGEGDLVAANMTITRQRRKDFLYSTPYMRSPQVLIQRKPENWSDLSDEAYEHNVLRDPTYLAGKKVVVWKNSSYYSRLIHLQDEIGDSILIEGESGLTGAEDLIEMVSEGLIDYTVADRNIALVNEQFLDNIDVKTEISVRQKIAFAMRKSSLLLHARVDKWLHKFMKKKTFKYIKSKYFDVEYLAKKSLDYFTTGIKGGQLSIYDEAFKMAAAKFNWDWRLLASLAYNESKFNPNVRGFGGAYGMMQFMPGTGPKYGVYPQSPPEIQIMGGMKKLYYDYESWKSIPDKVQRQKFTIATYNAGKGHIQDAQRLAKKHGLNPLRWDDNVEKMMLNLSKGEYYRDEVVQNGALRGAHTYNYVRAIYNRYLEWAKLYN